jgi:hypothetical protein
MFKVISMLFYGIIALFIVLLGLIGVKFALKGREVKEDPNSIVDKDGYIPCSTVEDLKNDTTSIEIDDAVNGTNSFDTAGEVNDVPEAKLSKDDLLYREIRGAALEKAKPGYECDAYGESEVSSAVDDEYERLLRQCQDDSMEDPFASIPAEAPSYVKSGS